MCLHGRLYDLQVQEDGSLTKYSIGGAPSLRI